VAFTGNLAIRRTFLPPGPQYRCIIHSAGMQLFTVSPHAALYSINSYRPTASRPVCLSFRDCETMFPMILKMNNLTLLVVVTDEPCSLCGRNCSSTQRAAEYQSSNDQRTCLDPPDGSFQRHKKLQMFFYVSVLRLLLRLHSTSFRFFIPVVFYANEGGWVRQNTTVVGSYLLVRW
jgi:hypothetical protein